MTDRKSEFDRELDHAAAEIAAQQIDAETEDRIVDRVWQKVASDHRGQSPLRSCDDFQREIPALVAGTLPEARALLVADHTRQCVACRRALMQERGELRETGPTRTARSRSRTARIALRVAAAAILVLTGIGSVRLAGDFMANRSLRATVASVDGSIQLVQPEGTLDLSEGRAVLAQQILRTTKDSGAMVRLADGSVIEMNERSEIELRGSRRGTTIDLQRGNIIVHAADQHGGRLFVATADCEVAVKGTIFSVNHGLKGSRVSVLEGEVEVREGSSSATLKPGDQITTSDRLRKIPIEEEIAWSKDADQHRQLIIELTALRRVVTEAVDTALPRTSTFLLDLAPGDTFAYAAMPNISEGLDDARRAFEERLAASPVLNEWWQSNVVDTGVESEIFDLLDRLQPIGEALGDEAVVAIPRTIMEDSGMPLFMAELDDEGAFRSQLEDLVQQAMEESGGAAEIAIIDDPRTTDSASAQVLLWSEGNLFAAAADLGTLQALAGRVDDPSARAFVNTRLHSRLSNAYAGGVSWLFAADVAAVIAEAMTQMQDDEAEMVERMGLSDVTTFIVERHRDGEWYATDAELQFSAQRSGIMAWLADPAPMGSLEFVSPQAYVAASAVTRDPALMFDDLLAILAERDASIVTQLHMFQSGLGIDIREDLAATLGGESTFALDGPMLPVPSWKLILEVYDPATLVHGLATAIAQLNPVIEGQGHPPVLFEEESAGGRTYYTVRSDGVDGRAVFSVIDGYLVMGPSRAVVDQAIAQRDSGVNLANSDQFRSLLPDNGFTDCSALAYRDLGSLVNAVPAEFLEEFELTGALTDELSTGLVCVFGGDSQITASATGGSLLGIGSVLGMSTAIHAEKAAHEAVREIHQIENADEAEPVSSLG